MDGIDFYVTDNFGEGLYDSCKDVKFGTMNSRALEFIGAGAQNFKGSTVPSEIFPPSMHVNVHILFSWRVTNSKTKEWWIHYRISMFTNLRVWG